MNFIADAIITAIYNLCILAGTTYLVVDCNWTPWTYFFCLFFLGSWDLKDAK